jgi:hypothetical protein
MRSSYGDVTQNLSHKLSENELTIKAQRKSILDIKKFLNESYSHIRNDNFASIAASVFPMLGILGTFIAIAISMPNFSVSDTASLDHEISLLLSGVGSAFYASIYGILLSLIWTYFEKRGMSKIHNYFSMVEESFSHKVWSEDALAIYKLSQHNASEQLNFDVMQKVMQETNVNFSHVAQTITIASQELSKTLTQLHQDNNALNAQKAIANSITEFTKTTHSFDNTLNQNFEKIDNEIGQIVVKLADFATHVSLESGVVQKSISEYHATVAQKIKEQ